MRRLAVPERAPDRRRDPYAPVAATLGVRDPRESALYRADEIVASAYRPAVPGVVEGVVVVELALRFACHVAEDVHVAVAHGRAPPR